MYELYSTDGCHLCELAFEQVEQLTYAQRVTVVDIIEDDALVAAYGVRIPVIKHISSQEELAWPFSIDELSSFFQQHGDPD